MVQEYATQAPKINQRFLCVTDHGMMGAVPSQIKACEEHGIHPIFGVELYVHPNQPEILPGQSMPDFVAHLPEVERKKMRKTFHLTAIAYTTEGYENLVQLTSWGWLRGFYYRPRVNHEQLIKHREGIIFLSGCYNGEIGQAFDNAVGRELRGEGPDEAAAMAMVEKYMAMFGENFYLEMMLLDFHKQKPYDIFLQKVHAKYGIPMVVTQDCHYCKKEDSLLQRNMLMIQTNTSMQDLEEAKAKNADLFELQDHNLWMKSEDELNQFWESRYVDDVDYDLFKQAKANTVLICERAKGVELDRSIKLPKLPDENDVLKEEIFKGFRRRQLPMTKEYSDRLKEEYSLICDKEFSSYFLIEQMMTDEARRVAPEILGFGDGSEAVGPGRGCLSPMTPIRLASGETCSMRDVKIGKKVFTIDGTIQKVKNIFRYDLKDECLLKIKTFYGDYLGVELTKDHKVYVEKQVRPLRWDRWKNSTKKSRKSFDEPIGKLSWLRADEISVGDWCFVPIPKVEIYNTEFDLSVENTSLKNGKKLWADSSYVYHEFNSKIGRDKRVMLRNWKLDEQWAFVLGVFVGDGWTRKEDRGEVGFCDNTKSTDNHLEFIENIFKNIGCDSSWFYAKNKNVKQLIIKSHYMRKLFDKLHPFYEHTACTKHVPECVLHGSETIVLAYLNGYFLSDGHEGKNKASFTTVSRTLAEQIRFLLLRVGLPSSLLLDERTDSREEYSNRQNSYVITFPLSKHVGCSRDTKEKYVWRKIDGGLLLRIMEISETFDVKEVFDLEIENNHNFLTSSFLVHNSACGSLVCYCLGITDVNPIPHGLLFSRFLSPARGGKSMKVRFTQKPVGVEMVTVVEELDEKSGSEPVKVEFGEVDVQQVYQMAKERHAKRSGRQGNLDAHNLEDIAVGILAELACEWLGFGFMDKKIYDGLGDNVTHDLYDKHGVGVGHVKAKRPLEPGWLLSKQEPFKQNKGEPVFFCNSNIGEKSGIVYVLGFAWSEEVVPIIKLPYVPALQAHKDGLWKKDLNPLLKPTTLFLTRKD